MLIIINSYHVSVKAHLSHFSYHLCYLCMHGILEIIYTLRLVEFLVFTHMMAFGYLLLIWPYELNQTGINNHSAAIQRADMNTLYVSPQTFAVNMVLGSLN